MSRKTTKQFKEYSEKEIVDNRSFRSVVVYSSTTSFAVISYFFSIHNIEMFPLGSVARGHRLDLLIVSTPKFCFFFF